MVTETAVVRMFLNRHDLDAVVSCFDDAGQDVILEFGVSADFFGVLRHTDMTFINEQRACVDFETVVVPNVRMFGCPDLRRKNFCLVVLNDTLRPSGDAFAFAVIPAHIHFVKVAVFELVGGQFKFPVTVFEFLATISLVFLPTVEVADQINIGSVRSPFAENPTVGCFMKPEVEVTVGEIGQSLFAVLSELSNFPERVVVTAANSLLVRFEPSVLFDQPDVFCSHISISCLSEKMG